MSLKKCRKCGDEKPATTEYFHKEKRNADGLYSYCKVCKRQYEMDNADRISRRVKERRLANLEQSRARTREWYHQNKDKRAIYLENNKGRIESYLKENKEKIKQRDKEYKERHKEHIVEYRKWYNATKKEVIRARRSTPQGLEKSRKYCQKRRSLKRQLEATLTPEQWEACVTHFESKCAYCGRARKLEQDHFLPISKGGEYSVNNIVPSCTTCNRQKHNHDFMEWYPTSKQFSKVREQKILKYLGYKQNTQQLTLTF